MEGSTHRPLREDTWRPCILDHNSFQDSGSFSTVEVPLLSASTSRCASPSPSLPPLLYHSPPSNPPQNDNEALEVHLDPSIDSKKPRIVLRDPVFLELIEKSGASSVSSETCLPREQPDPGDFPIRHNNISLGTDLALRETEFVFENDSAIAQSFKAEVGGPTYLADLDNDPHGQISGLFHLDASVGNTPSSVEQARFAIWNLFPNAYGLPRTPWSHYGVVPDLLNMDLHSLYLSNSLEKGKILPNSNKLVPKVFEAGFCAKEFSLSSRHSNKPRPLILRYRLCGNLGQFEAFISHEKQHEISQGAWNQLCSAVLHSLAPAASRRLSFERLASDFFSGNPVLDDDSYEKAINEQTPILNQQEDAAPRETLTESKAYVISHQGSDWSEILRISTKNDGSLIAFLLDTVKCNNLDQCSKKSSMRYCALRVRRELRKAVDNPVQPGNPLESLLDDLAEDEQAHKTSIKLSPKGDVISSQTAEPLCSSNNHLHKNPTIASGIELGVGERRRSKVTELGQLASTSSTERIYDRDERSREASEDVDGSSEFERKKASVFGSKSQLNIDQGTNGIVIGEPTSGIAPYYKANTSPSNVFYNDQANLAVMVEQSGGYSSTSDSLAKDKPDTPNHQQSDTKTRVKSKNKPNFKKQKIGDLSSIDMPVDAEMNRPDNVVQSTFYLFSELELTSFVGPLDIEDGGDWSVVQPRSSRKATGLSQTPGELSSDPRILLGTIQGSLTGPYKDTQTKSRQHTLPKGSSIPPRTRGIIKALEAVQTHTTSGSQVVRLSSNIHTHNLVSANVSNRRDVEKTRAYNQDECLVMPSKSVQHNLVKPGLLGDNSTKSSPQSRGTSNTEQNFEGADLLHLDEGENDISSCYSISKHTLPRTLTPLTRISEEPKELAKFEDSVENDISTPSNRGEEGCHKATKALKSDSSEILAAAQEFTSSSCAMVGTRVQKRGELGNGDSALKDIAPINAPIPACGVMNGQSMPACSLYIATDDHKPPKCRTDFHPGGAKADETEEPVGSFISPRSETPKSILSAYEDATPRPTAPNVKQICRYMSFGGLRASPCQRNIRYRRTASENVASGECDDDAFAEGSFVNEEIAGSEIISRTIDRAGICSHHNEANHGFATRSEGFSVSEGNSHAQCSNAYARSSRPHGLSQSFQSNHWATPITYHNRYGLTSQVTYAHVLSVPARVSTGSPIANGSSSPGILHHRHPSSSKQENTQYHYTTTGNLNYAPIFALAGYQRADMGGYHQKLMQYPFSEPPQFTFSCTYCNVMVVASSETPQIMCLGCGLESNIRYCSIACLQADSYDHSESCVHWPIFQKVTYFGLPESLHPDSSYQEDPVYSPSCCSDSAENSRRQRLIEAHPNIQLQYSLANWHHGSPELRAPISDSATIRNPPSICL